MSMFRASAHYGDWEGTASADDLSLKSIQDYLKSKGALSGEDYLLAVSLAVDESLDGNIPSIFVQAYIYNGENDYEKVQTLLNSLPGPIPISEVNVSITLPNFLRACFINGFCLKSGTYV
jgi:hypothetical protein